MFVEAVKLIVRNGQYKKMPFDSQKEPLFAPTALTVSFFFVIEKAFCCTRMLCVRHGGLGWRSG